MNKTFLKNLVSIILLTIFFVSIFSLPNFSFAQDSTEYQLLEPSIPFIGVENGKTTAAKFLPGIFQLIIALAGAIAVVRLVFGGIQYMSTDAFSGKSSAKSTINSALAGLALILSSWLILNTINPELTSFNLNIEGLRVGEDISAGLGSETVEGDGWEPDFIIRTRLALSGIIVNKPNCEEVGQSGCTSVTNINPSVIAGLENLVENCAERYKNKDRCNIVITGGTEYWLHGNKKPDIQENTSQHKNGKVIDISITGSRFTQFIQESLATNQAGCVDGGLVKEKRMIDGVIFVYEKASGSGPVQSNADHWHVCFP